jgi:hypothetical protein
MAIITVTLSILALYQNLTLTVPYLTVFERFEYSQSFKSRSGTVEYGSVQESKELVYLRF